MGVSGDGDDEALAARSARRCRRGRQRVRRTDDASVVGFSMGGALALRCDLLGMVDRVVSFDPSLSDAQAIADRLPAHLTEAIL
jgi:dienelactone hydrolase